MKTSAGIFKHLLTGSFFLVLFACKKGMIDSQADSLSDTGKQRTAKTLGVTPDIYVAGSLSGQAAYWKNGVVTILSGGIGAKGIDVVGTDVYVCGYGQNSTTGMYTALYWINGVLTALTDGTTSDGMTTGIGVKSTGEVYIAGYTGRYSQTPVYWLNGVVGGLLNANGTPTAGGIPGAVCVSANDDVYMANINGQTPSYWKNGTLVPLQLPAVTTYSSHAEAVKEVNGVVYAVGYYGPGSTFLKPLYWANGTLSETFLGTRDALTEPKDIAVSASGQKFVAGIGGNVWGQEHTMTWDNVGAPDYWGFNTVTAYPRVVWDGTDVYVTGSEQVPGGHSRAMYWVNGGSNPTILNSPSTEANAVDIKVVH